MSDAPSGDGARHLRPRPHHLPLQEDPVAERGGAGEGDRAPGGAGDDPQRRGASLPQSRDLVADGGQGEVAQRQCTGRPSHSGRGIRRQS